jgi:hypothetical protein
VSEKLSPELLAKLKRSLLWEFAYLNVPEEDVTILEPQQLDGNTKWGIAGEAMKDGELIRRAVREAWT